MKDIPAVKTVRLVNSVDGPIGQATTINASEPGKGNVRISVQGDAVLVESQKGLQIIPLANVAFIVPMPSPKPVEAHKAEAKK